MSVRKGWITVTPSQHALTFPMALFVCVLLATLGMEHPVMVYIIITPNNTIMLHYHTFADSNICELGVDDCSSHGICINNISSFECECLPGFSGDGVTCECG